MRLRSPFGCRVPSFPEVYHIFTEFGMDRMKIIALTYKFYKYIEFFGRQKAIFGYCALYMNYVGLYGFFIPLAENIIIRLFNGN